MLHDATSPHGTIGVCQTPPALAPKPEPRRQSANQSAEGNGARVLLSAADAARSVFGISLRKFQQLEHEPWFPRPVGVLGPRLKRYVRAELEAAVLNMPRREGPHAPEPTQLLRSRIERAKRTGVLA